jgi:hypothetical protein
MDRDGMMTMRNKALTMLAALALAGCGGAEKREADATPVDATATNVETGVPAAADPALPHGDAVAASARADAVATPAFAGTWTGPEGLSFVVTRTPGGGYRVKNRDTLDTEQTFDAVADGATLRFERRGKAQVARPGSGSETGFKWLANKKNCLIVETGVEGYCRD